MSLQLSTAITGGIKRGLTRTGGILFAVFLAFQLLNITLTNTVTKSMVPPGAAPGSVGLSLPLPATLAGGLLVGVYVFLTAFFVVIPRAFARPMAELSTFPSELYTRRMGWAVLSMVVASIIVFVSVSLGFVLLIIPGIFLALSFMFFIFAISVEDRGIIESLQRSWGLARGNRLKLLGILGLIVVVSVLTSVPSTLFQLAGISVLGDIFAVGIGSLTGVFYNGILADAYLQLAGPADTAL